MRLHIDLLRPYTFTTGLSNAIRQYSPPSHFLSYSIPSSTARNQTATHHLPPRCLYQSPTSSATCGKKAYSVNPKSSSPTISTPALTTPPRTDNKVVFCTGGAGTICSAQVRALVSLGANACIVGRNVAKTEAMAHDIATARPGAKVLGIGAVDVRQAETLQNAVERCVRELGSVDFVMYVMPNSGPTNSLSLPYRISLPKPSKAKSTETRPYLPTAPAQRATSSPRSSN